MFTRHRSLVSFLVSFLLCVGLRLVIFLVNFHVDITSHSRQRALVILCCALRQQIML